MYKQTFAQPRPSAISHALHVLTRWLRKIGARLMTAKTVRDRSVDVLALAMRDAAFGG